MNKSTGGSKMKWRSLISLTVLMAFLSISAFAAVAVAGKGDLEKITKAITQKHSRWSAKENPISRLSPEKRRKRLGSKYPMFSFSEKILSDASAPLPAKLDWRDYNGNNFVTPVKDQGECGACWAFAVTAALESKVLISENNSDFCIDLSEQVLNSCSGAGNCEEGYINKASDFISSYGLPPESCYPYTESDGSCSDACSDWGQMTYKVPGWTLVDPTVDAIKGALYNRGPLVVLMAVQSDFLFYSSGIYSHSSGEFEGYHAALVVGYDDTEQYFIVKSSWGTEWGEDGYFRIAYSEISSDTVFGCWAISYNSVISSDFPVIDDIPRSASIGDTDTSGSGSTGNGLYGGQGSDGVYSNGSAAEGTNTAGNEGNGANNSTPIMAASYQLGPIAYWVYEPSGCSCLYNNNPPPFDPPPYVTICSCVITGTAYDCFDQVVSTCESGGSSSAIGTIDTSCGACFAMQGDTCAVNGVSMQEMVDTSPRFNEVSCTLTGYAGSGAGGSGGSGPGGSGGGFGPGGDGGDGGSGPGGFGPGPGPGGNGGGDGGDGGGDGGDGGPDPCATSSNVSIGSAANIQSGNLYFTKNVGGITLTYNSNDLYDGSLGKKWLHEYGLTLRPRLSNQYDTTLILRSTDGNNVYFTLSNGVYYPSDSSGYTTQIVKNTNGSYTMTAKNGLVYQFSSAGKLTSIADRNGNTTTLTYDSIGNLLSITGPSGRTTRITTDDGRITVITDPGYRIYTLAYSPTSGMLETITDPLNNAWHYTYDTTGRMVEKQDPEGHQTIYTYDSNGRLSTSQDPNDETRTVTYNQGTSTTTIEEKDGGDWIYQYDPTLVVKTQKTDPLGNTTHYTYDSKRNLTSITNPDGSMTLKTYEYDENNKNLISLTVTSKDSQGAVVSATSYTYNSLNLVTRITDPMNGEANYTYSSDGKGNLVSIAAPIGTTTFQYNTKGFVTSMTNPNNHTTVFAYDSQTNDLTSITDPLNHVTSFTYDAVGNRRSMMDPLNHETTYDYNDLNQMTKVTDPKGNETHFTYDYDGNVLTTTDANDRTTQYEYNYAGQVTEITDALNHRTQMTYGPTGCSGCGNGGVDKLSALTDALNHVTGYQYDLAGRLTKETDPQNREINYTYYSNGNLHTKTKPDSRTITYTYDVLKRLTQKQYTGGSSVQYQYDANGNMTSASNSAISYTFAYDANNRLTQVADSYSKTIQYQYDSAGNRTKMITLEDQTIDHEIDYEYDDANRLTDITFDIPSDTSDPQTFTFGYNAASRRTGLTLPNGTAAAYTYDNNGNLSQISHTGSNQTVLAEVNHTYDVVNNRLTRTDNATGADPAVGTDTMTYGTANELLTLNTTAATFSYDLNGNRYQKTETGDTATYTYDDENRLAGVTTTGGQAITYAYDPLGRRIEKNVNGTITRYLYDGEDIILEYDQAGTVTARYIHGPGIDEPLAMEKNSQTYYYHVDDLGSIIALTDSTGAVAQSYQYDAFGNMTNGTPTITQPYTYTAREYDSETGLYYYRARHYDPIAGRFLQRDPISFAGGDVNLYAYVGNNPLYWIDPWGKEWFVKPGDSYVFGINDGPKGKWSTAGSEELKPIERLANMHQTAIIHDNVVDYWSTGYKAYDTYVVNYGTMIPSAVVSLIWNILTTPSQIPNNLTPKPSTKYKPCE
jgi:RHS repeat-associated protein